MFELITVTRRLIRTRVFQRLLTSKTHSNSGRVGKDLKILQKLGHFSTDHPSLAPISRNHGTQPKRVLTKFKRSFDVSGEIAYA